MGKRVKCTVCGSTCRAEVTQICSSCSNATYESLLRPSASADIPPVPHLYGSYAVISDLHVPFHDPDALTRVIETCAALGVRRLIIAGDLLHADLLSRFDTVGKAFNMSDELRAARQVLEAFSRHFDEIHVLPGNHDFRIDRTFAAMLRTSTGRAAVDIICGLLGDVPSQATPSDLSVSLIRHFLSNSKVTVYPLSDLVLNDVWFIQHPGTASREAPSAERKVSAKKRMSVLQGHSHLFAVGFDVSGTDVAANIGHLCDDSQFRYKREKPSTFPETIKGFCVIIDEGDSGSYIIPIAIHPKWFTVERLRSLLGGSV